MRVAGYASIARRIQPESTVNIANRVTTDQRVLVVSIPIRVVHAVVLESVALQACVMAIRKARLCLRWILEIVFVVKDSLDLCVTK